MGSPLPTFVRGKGVIPFPVEATPPLLGEANKVVEAEPKRAFNRDPRDLVFYTNGDSLGVKNLLEHYFLSHVQLESLLEDFGKVPLIEKAAIFNENPPILGRPKH